MVGIKVSSTDRLYANDDSLQTNLIKDLIHQAFSGSGKELVLAALRGHVSKKEREEIQQILSRKD